jgi:hypothetical protein
MVLCFNSYNIYSKQLYLILILAIYLIYFLSQTIKFLIKYEPTCFTDESLSIKKKPLLFLQFTIIIHSRKIISVSEMY